MKNYIQTLLNLPAILARIERKLAVVASEVSEARTEYHPSLGSRITGITNIMGGRIDERLADRPTHADIVLVKEEIGVRLDKLEAQALPAVKTGEPPLGGTVRIGWDMAAGDGATFMTTVKESVVDGQTHREATGQSIKITKARKPRKPKGGQ